MTMNQIKGGAILSYFNLGLNVLIGLVYTPWMIKSIGQADYGLYTLAMSIIGLLAFDFGLGNATTKFICEYLAQKRQDKVDALLGLVAKLYLGMDLLLLSVFIGVYLFLPEIYDGLTSGELNTFRIVFIIAAFYCTFSFPFIPLNGILTGYEKFVQLKCCDMFQRVFIVVTMAICLVCGYGLFALVIVNSVSGIIAILLKLVLIRRNTPLKVNLRFWDSGELRRIFSFVVWVTIIALAQRMIFNIAPSILGRYADTSQIAILGVAITIESYTYLFANAIGGLFLPRVSQMVVGNDVKAVQKLMVRVGRLQIFVCGFIFIWFIAFGGNFINLWVGQEYSPVYACAILFLIPIIIQLPQEIGMTYIVAANKVRQQAFIYIGMAVTNVALAVPLAKHFGVYGLSWAIFASYCLRTIALDIMFQKRLGLDIVDFFKASFGQLIVPLTIAALVFLALTCIPLGGWPGLLTKSLLAVISYAGIIWMISNDSEKELFSTLSHRK